MSEAEIFDKVKKIVMKQLLLKLTMLHHQANFANDLGLIPSILLN